MLLLRHAYCWGKQARKIVAGQKQEWAEGRTQNKIWVLLQKNVVLDLILLGISYLAPLNHFMSFWLM